MSTTETYSPARAIAEAFRSIKAAMSVQFRAPDQIHRTRRPNDIRHLDDHLLKDIGYMRLDSVALRSNGSLERLQMLARS